MGLQSGEYSLHPALVFVSPCSLTEPWLIPLSTFYPGIVWDDYGYPACLCKTVCFGFKSGLGVFKPTRKQMDLFILKAVKFL